MSWVRLWHDMPTDPIWRVIAKRSDQRVGDVIAMFAILMTQAGANAAERGRTNGNDDDEIAAALDLNPDDVTNIRSAMQGKVLDGEILSGWEKRQPKREDNSAARAKAWREERSRTQPNAAERPDADADADNPPTGGTRKRMLPSDFIPVLTDGAQTIVDRIGAARYAKELDRFRDHHRARGSTMKDWQAAFRTWLSRCEEYGGKNGANRNGIGSSARGESGWTSALRDASVPRPADDT